MSGNTVWTLVALTGALNCSGISQDKPAATPTKEAPTGSPASGQATEPFRTHILLVTSHAEIEQWVLSTPEERATKYRPVRTIARNRAIYAPFIVTEYQPSAAGIALTADFELVGPDGTVRHSAKDYSGSEIMDQRTPGLVVLNPVLELTAEDSDPSGTYRIRVTVRDGVRSARAEEVFVIE